MTTPIEVLIPVNEKDLAILPHGMNSVRKHLKSPIQQVSRDVVK